MIGWLLWVLGIRARDTRKELIEELSRLHQNHHRLKDSYNTLYEDYEEREKTIKVLENRIDQLTIVHGREVEQLRKAALVVHSASAGTDGFKLATMRESFYAVQKDNRALTDRVAKLKAANKKLRLHLNVIQ